MPRYATSAFTHAAARRTLPGTLSSRRFVIRAPLLSAFQQIIGAILRPQTRRRRTRMCLNLAVTLLTLGRICKVENLVNLAHESKNTTPTT